MIKNFQILNKDQKLKNSSELDSFTTLKNYVRVPNIHKKMVRIVNLQLLSIQMGILLE